MARRCTSRYDEAQPIKTEAHVGKFEVYRDSAGEFRFRLRAANGEVIAASEGYKTRAGCENGIESVRKNAPTAPIVDTDE